MARVWAGTPGAMLKDTDRQPSIDLELGGRRRERFSFENPVVEEPGPPTHGRAGVFESELDDGSAAAVTFESEDTGRADIVAKAFESEVDGSDSIDGVAQSYVDNMLQDLLLAFDSADVDQNGVLDARELLAMVRVLGGAERAQKLELETMEALIKKEWEQLERRAKDPSAADECLEGMIKVVLKQKAAGAGAMAANALKKGVQRMTGNSVHKGEDLTISTEELDYPMFVHLITSGRAGDFIGEKHEDWRDHVRKLRLLKWVWNIADADGDGELTKEEMHDVATTLLGHMTEEDFAAFWDLVTPSKDTKSLLYLDYVNGMAKAQFHPVFADKLEFLKPNLLMTVSLDVPVDRKEEKLMLSLLTSAERLGVNYLKRTARRADEKNTRRERDTPRGEPGSARDAALYDRLTQGTVHMLADGQRKQMRNKHQRMIAFGCLFGFISSLGTALSENVATYYLNTNGVENPDTGEPSSKEDIKKFVMIVFSTLVVCSIIEISMLYIYALRHVMQTAQAAGLRLTPLNRDRTHIAQFLIQAALELAHHNNTVHGVDPLKDTKEQGKCLVIVFVVLYKAKIALTSFLLKVALKRLVSRDAAKYAVPYMAVPATMLWNALISHGVMKQAKLRSIGIAAAVELFDSILNESADPAVDKSSGPTEKLSPLFKLQLLRAVGVVIVKRKSLYPTQEVLLKHAVHTLRMSAEVDNTIGYVDSEHDFIANMGQLSCKEQGQCLQVFVLATILDGHFLRAEKKLYRSLCASVNDQFEPHTTYIQHCAQRLRNAQPVTDVDVRHCVYWTPGDGAHELTYGYYISECLHSVFSVCAC